MAKKITQTLEDKARLIAKSQGLESHYELDTSLGGTIGNTPFESSNLSFLSSNNARVQSSEFELGVSTVSTSLTNSANTRSTLLDQTNTGISAFQREGYSIDTGFDNFSQPTSLLSFGNSASINPTSNVRVYSGRTQPKLSIEEFLGATNNAAPNTLESVPQGTPNTVSNQLSQFASYNCIFSLGVLTRNSVSDPRNTYRKRGADFTILKSGGGGIDARRITTAFDSNTVGNLEYFIDNFEMSSVLAPNSKTGMSIGTRVAFQVHEPYSLGIFLQNLKIAASSANYRNYIDAAYLLELDFIGWDTDGNSKPVNYASRKIPIKIASIDFDASQGGTTYNVVAYPWNHQALSDVVQKINDPVSIKGSSIADALSFGDQSLTSILNSKLREIASASELPASDLYVIRFPKSRTTTGQAGATSVEETGATTTPRGAQTSVIYTDRYINRVNSYFGGNTPTANNNVYQKLTGNSTTDVNIIGRSLVVDNFNQGNSHPFPLGLATYDKVGDIFRRDGIELTLNDKERTFKFPQGMTIQKIIEEMVLLSSYTTNALDHVDKEGMRTWFTIETECHILESPEVEDATGNSPKVYVYNVVPYRVHAGNTLPPTQASTGHDALALQVSKEYNYLYSGQNEDVIGFDIKFNTAFYTALRADYGNLSGSDVSGAKDQAVSQGSAPSHRLSASRGDISDITTRNKVTSEVGPATGGSEFTDPKRNLARAFHNIILNEGADLITADLEIWGDPYYLPDSGAGNYSSSNSGQTATLTADGGIDYQRNEVDILVNFRTPVDYNAQGGMDFQSDTTRVDGFSGFYKVTTVENTISGNKFTQTLKLVRRTNQSTDGISTSPVLQESSTNPLNQNAEKPAEQTGSPDS
jgi:hypothetical protein